MKVYFAYYIQTNAICIAILSILLIKSLGRDGRTSSNALWRSIIVSTEIYCVADIVSAVFRGNAHAYARTVLWISNAIYIGFPLVIALLWLKYVDSLVKGRLFSGKTVRALLIAPAAVLFLLLIINPWTGFAFELDADNTYSRGFLAYIVPVLCWIYMAYAEVVILKNKRYLKNRFGRNKTLSLLLFIAPPIAVSIIQLCIYGLSLSQVGFTLSVLLILLDNQNDRIATDGMTGVSNRNEFDRHLGECIDKTDRTTLFIIDVDKFKSINDIYGHIEGDSALILVAGVIKHVCQDVFYNSKLFFARYGGDEFAIIGLNLEKNMPETICNVISKEVEATAKLDEKPYEITVSIGYATAEKDDRMTTDDLISAADEAMYVSKNAKQMTEG